jgi:hypothetical protein
MFRKNSVPGRVDGRRNRVRKRPEAGERFSGSKQAADSVATIIPVYQGGPWPQQNYSGWQAPRAREIGAICPGNGSNGGNGLAGNWLNRPVGNSGLSRRALRRRRCLNFGPPTGGGAISRQPTAQSLVNYYNAHAAAKKFSREYKIAANEFDPRIVNVLIKRSLMVCFLRQRSVAERRNEPSRFGRVRFLVFLFVEGARMSSNRRGAGGLVLR